MSLRKSRVAEERNLRNLGVERATAIREGDGERVNLIERDQEICRARIAELTRQIGDEEDRTRAERTAARHDERTYARLSAQYRAVVQLKLHHAERDLRRMARKLARAEDRPGHYRDQIIASIAEQKTWIDRIRKQLEELS